jgi:hypothetical protein
MAVACVAVSATRSRVRSRAHSIATAPCAARHTEQPSAAARELQRPTSAGFKARSSSRYESSQGNHRGFCRVCGTALLSRFDFDRSAFGLPLGALDDDPGVKPEMHVFVASKAPWFEITDDLLRFDDFPRPGGLVANLRASDREDTG